jgi:biotin carboxylase
MKAAVLFLEPKGTVLEVIRAAKKRGFRVIVFSSDKNLIFGAPYPYRSATPLIDEVIGVESWENESEILPVVDIIQKDHPIKGVYSGIDPCAALCVTLREKLGLPTPKLEAVSRILNKYELRKVLRELGLSKIKNLHRSEADTLTEWPFKGPAYFKPVHGFFSAYVVRCETLDDFKKAKRTWEQGNKSDPLYVKNYLNSVREYHLEEAFDGELLSVEAISHGGNFECLGLLSRILYSKNPIVEMGSCFPYPHPLADKIISLVEKAHKDLGFTDGPSHTEVIVNKDGEIEIIDFNPRFVGADVLQSVNHAYGISIEDALLDWAIGQDFRVQKKDEKFSCLQYVLPPNVSKFESIEFPERPEIKFSTSFMEPGSTINSSNRQLDYLGCYLTVMPTFQEAILKSRALRRHVKINRSLEGAY